MTRAILLIAFLMEPARPASSQVAPHDLNKVVDKRHQRTGAGGDSPG
jgi:hypothetical protein